MSDPDPAVALELRRQACLKNTVRETIALGYRLQVVCLCCDHRPVVDLPPLARRGYADRRLEDLPFTCDSCRRHRRKMSIHPPGKDVYVRVMFPGERPSVKTSNWPYAG